MMKTNLLLSALILITINASSQIIYTDIDDNVAPSIDFNGDGTAEFMIESEGVFAPIGYAIYYNGPDNYNIHAISIDQHNIPDCVDFGFVINATSNWYGLFDSYLDAFGAGNPTITANQDEYLGMKFSFLPEDTNIYYGWVRFSIDDIGNITYKDYAYESTPNTAIAAGAKPELSVNEFDLANQINIYPNPAKDLVTIKYKFKTTNSKIVINDLFGKQIWQTQLLNGEKTMDVSKLNSGLYFVSLIEDGKKIGNKKLIVNH